MSRLEIENKYIPYSIHTIQVNFSFARHWPPRRNMLVTKSNTFRLHRPARIYYYGEPPPWDSRNRRGKSLLAQRKQSLEFKGERWFD